jgi:DNA-directed RNA polymerase specialized sigma24 family protein
MVDMIPPPNPAGGTAGADSGYEAAVEQLPAAYALVLRLTDAGTPKGDICKRLGIEPEGLDALLDLAARKLRTKLTETS